MASWGYLISCSRNLVYTSSFVGKADEAWLLSCCRINETRMNYALVIKRPCNSKHFISTLVRTQNRELCFRCTAYNMHRLTNLVIILIVSI